MAKHAEETKIDTYLDSSDDEAEEAVLKVFSSSPSRYYNYLYTNLSSYLGDDSEDNINLISYTKNIHISLGLLLHNFADRLFRQSKIAEVYKTMKAKHNFAVTSKQYYDAIGKLPSSVEDSEGTSDKQKIKLLAKAFEKAPVDISSVNLEGLNRKPFVFELPEDSRNAAGMLALSKLANRNGKDTLKLLATRKLNHDTVDNYYFPHTKMQNFGNAFQNWYLTGKKQMRDTAAVGNYDKIMELIPKENGIREQFVKRIFCFVKAEDLTNEEVATWIKVSKVSSEINYNFVAEQIAYLFFIMEMQRNVSTLFTAPMFLELAANNPDFITRANFPMALPDATEMTRGVYSKYSSFLPNPNTMDYGQYDEKEKKWAKLLVSMGKFTIKWHLNCKDDLPVYRDIVTAIDCVNNIASFLRASDPLLTVIKAKFSTIKTHLELLGKQLLEPTIKGRLLELLDIVEESASNKRDSTGIAKAADAALQVECNKLLELFKDNTQVFIKTSNKSLKFEMINIIASLSKKITEWYSIDIPDHLKLDFAFGLEEKKSAAESQLAKGEVEEVGLGGGSTPVLLDEAGKTPVVGVALDLD